MDVWMQMVKVDWQHEKVDIIALVMGALTNYYQLVHYLEVRLEWHWVHC